MPESWTVLSNSDDIYRRTADFTGLKERLERELLEIRPFKSTHRVLVAKKPSLDAWYGARDFAGSNDFERLCMTKEDYYEMGGEYLKEHHCSNKYYRSPAPLDNMLAPAGDANVAKEEVVIDF